MVLRHIRRYPLGLSYPDVIDSIRETLAARPCSGQATLIIDASGPGLPVYDIIRKSTGFPASRIVPVTITAGDRVSRSHPHYRIPRRHLLSNLFTLITTRKFTLADGLHLGTVFLRELQQLRLTHSAAGNESLQPASSSQHDDLVLATALAAFFAATHNPLRPTHGPLPGLHPYTP